MMGKAGNLKPARSNKEARERGQAGGKASGEARRRKRAMRERLQALLEGHINGAEGADALALALFEKALSGDVRAFSLIMDMVGQSPRPFLAGLPKVDTVADLPKLTGTLVQAVAEGDLTPEEGQKIGTLVNSHVKALELSELEQRITALEGKVKYE